jgi:hypothetical protein
MFVTWGVKKMRAVVLLSLQNIKKIWKKIWDVIFALNISISDVDNLHSRARATDTENAVAKCYKGFLVGNIFLFVVLYGC